MKKNLWLVGLGSFCLFLNSCQCSKKAEKKSPEAKVPFVDYQALPNNPHQAPDYSGIQILDVVKIELKEGQGKKDVQLNYKVNVAFSMWVYDPKKKLNQGLPIAGVPKAVEQMIEVGKSNVIKGLHTGLIGMKAGGKRRLLIPANQAYGSQGGPNIPPNSIVMVEVDLKKIN